MNSTGVAHELRSLKSLKDQDEKLYVEIMQQYASLGGDRKKRKGLIMKANSFTDDLQAIVPHLESISVDEYNWLTETAVRWEVIYSSIFNIPKDIRIAVTPDQLRPPEQTRVLTDGEVETWLQDKAHELSRIRKFNWLLKEADAIEKRITSTEEEMKQDWRGAQIEFASQVLSGKIDFVTQIASNSYHRLEHIWLRDVKQLRAFLTWEEGGSAWNLDGGTSDYYAACRQLRDMLVNRSIKRSTPEDFEEARAYVELHYLDKNGKLNRAYETEQLVDSKANRIWASSGEVNAERNWIIAETYVKQFYENIIPAVMMKDQEKTLLVLKALQLSEVSETNSPITNSFETAVAIYFLDMDVIETLWQEAVEKTWPERWTMSGVSLPYLPIGFVTPVESHDQLTVDYFTGQFNFTGVMTEAQREALLLDNKDDYAKQAIEELFRQSRLLPRELTI